MDELPKSSELQGFYLHAKERDQTLVSVGFYHYVPRNLQSFSVSLQMGLKRKLSGENTF